jgi:regulator of RNase E activity RraA
MSVGFRVLNRHRAVDLELAGTYRGLPVANVSDSMNRMTGGGTRLRPLHAGGYMSGPALTVKTRPGDNLMVHMALNVASPGDVIVVDAGGDLTNSLLGEMMLAVAARKQVAGIVIDGAVRDLAAIRASSLPLYAAGVTHRGPYKDGPGELNVPISIDGMVIEPGDLMIGDDDGILCVPFDLAKSVYDKSHAKHAREQASAAKIASGNDDRSRIEKRLRELGCEIDE